MKKLLFLLIAISLCSCTNKPLTAKSTVESYLNNYKNLSENVINDLNKVVENENIDDSLKDKYKEVLKREYENIDYKITDESYENNTAIVKVSITVYDLYLAQKEASEYLNNNISEFYDENNIYNKNKYIEYKLNKMLNQDQLVTYEIEFVTEMSDNTWIIKEVPKDTLEKIHGIYNYENKVSDSR